MKKWFKGKPKVTDLLEHGYIVKGDVINFRFRSIRDKNKRFPLVVAGVGGKTKTALLVHPVGNPDMICPLLEMSNHLKNELGLCFKWPLNPIHKASIHLNSGRSLEDLKNDLLEYTKKNEFLLEI